MSEPTNDFLARAKKLHETALVLDTHCDTTLRLMEDGWNIAEHHTDGHVDLPRARLGGVDAFVFAIWAPGPLEPGTGIASSRKQIERIRETVSCHSEDLALVRSADGILAARESGRLAIMIAIEGGYLIENSLDMLREYAKAGAVYMTLTHAFHTEWADSAGVHVPLGPLHGGLTEFGRDVVRLMNELGVMVDVSHVSDNTVRDVLSIAKSPVIATHSSCRAVSDHCRNLPDELMQAIAATGGVVQINFAASFIDPNHPPLDPDEVHRWWTDPEARKRPITEYRTPLKILADHFEHAIKLIGADHVGIGSDFDGIPTLPADMDDCSMLPNLTAELLRRGFTEQELTPMLGQNVLRVMDACRVGHSC